jgi:hypothetical protein
MKLYNKNEGYIQITVLILIIRQLKINQETWVKKINQETWVKKINQETYIMYFIVIATTCIEIRYIHHNHS